MLLIVCALLELKVMFGVAAWQAKVEDIGREISRGREVSTGTCPGAQREGHTTTLKKTGHKDGIRNPIQRDAGASSEHLQNVSTRHHQHCRTTRCQHVRTVRLYLETILEGLFIGIRQALTGEIMSQRETLVSIFNAQGIRISSDDWSHNCCYDIQSAE